jgi:hypothetical protein
MKIKPLFIPYILFILWMFLIPLMSKANTSSMDDCSEVNLITETNSPFQKIPVYNQEKINICYAYSAAQMVDYHLLKNGAKKRSVHPAWVALNYSLKHNRHQLEIGHTKEALESLAEASNCDYETVSDALKSWAKRNDVSEARILSYIERNTPTVPAAALRMPASLPSVTDLRTSNMTSVQVLSSLLTMNCLNKKSVSIPKAHKYNFEQLASDEAFHNMLVSKIRQIKSPLSIAYCSNVWKDADYKGIGLTWKGVRDSLKDDCHYHESLVVGRKKIGGSCHLLIRNTWGTRWTADNKNWKCVCRNKKSGDYADECRPETHPDSDYSVEACWLPSDKIASNTGLITFME